MSYWVPATGIRAESSVACLKPAVGAMLRQAPPKPRELSLCPSRSEFQTYNPGEFRGRWQATDLSAGAGDMSRLSPGVYFVREEGSGVQGSEGSSLKVVVTQ